LRRRQHRNLLHKNGPRHIQRLQRGAQLQGRISMQRVGARSSQPGTALGGSRPQRLACGQIGRPCRGLRSVVLTQQVQRTQQLGVQPGKGLHGRRAQPHQPLVGTHGPKNGQRQHGT